MKRTLAEQLYTIAIWADNHPDEYQKMPLYLRQSFSDSVKAVYECVPPSLRWERDACEKCDCPGREHKELGECPK